MSQLETTQDNSFCLTTSPRTHYQKRPGLEVRNAATHFVAPISMKEFIKSRLTINIKTDSFPLRHDQAGLLMVASDRKNHQTPVQWVRIGLENFRDMIQLSVVTTETNTDQSFHGSLAPDPKGGPATTATVELVKQLDPLGDSLWANYLILDEDGFVITRHPLREITWFFNRKENGEDIELHVGGFAARPARPNEAHRAEELLRVEFSGLVVDVD